MTTGQQDLRRMIVGDHTLTSTDNTDDATASDYATDGGEEDGESECESLSANAGQILEFKGVLPSQQYVDEKVCLCIC